MDNIELIDIETFHDATGEQIECWNHNISLDDDKEHELIMFDAMLTNPDIEAIDRSVEMIIRRHDSLRTYFRMIDGDVKQVVVPYDTEVFSTAYFDVHTEDDTDSAIRKAINLAKRSLRKLDGPPLMRCLMFKVSENNYYICFLIHHIISDRWSVSVLNREILIFYEAFSKGKEANIEPLKAQLKDYAIWQKRWLRENGDAAIDYWANKLGGLITAFSFERSNERLLELSRIPSSTVGTQKVNSIDQFLHILDFSDASSYLYRVPLSRYHRLLQLSNYCKCNILTLLTASLRLLFYITMGKEKTLLTFPLASRHIPGFEGIIGYLIGSTYMYRPVRAELSLKDLIKETYVDFFESSRHLIFNHDVMRLDGIALRAEVDVVVNFLSKEMTGGNKMLPVAEEGHQALRELPFYPLSYHVAEYADGLFCKWEHNLGLYSSSMIEFMVKKHEKIIQAMVEMPEISIQDLSDRI